MYKKVIKYTDYNGEEREEPFYFNLSQAELAEMELSTEGGMKEYINRIVETKSRPELVKIFKELILKSYGIKSDDGRRFIKRQNGRDLSEDFEQTEAYSVLFLELASDADAAANFVNGLTAQSINQQSSIPAPMSSV